MNYSLDQEALVGHTTTTTTATDNDEYDSIFMYLALPTCHFPYNFIHLFQL